MSEMPLSQY